MNEYRPKLVEATKRVGAAVDEMHDLAARAVQHLARGRFVRRATAAATIAVQAMRWMGKRRWRRSVVLLSPNRPAVSVSC